MRLSVGHCLNCESPLTGDYCANCGQSVAGPQRFFWTVLHEAFENLFQFNSRGMRTFWQTICLPGRVTRQYLDGKRQSYVSPIRFYIFASILFFVILSTQNFFRQHSSNADIRSENGTGIVVTVDEPEFEFSKVEVDLPLVSAQTNQRFDAFMSSQLKKLKLLLDEDPSEVIENLLELAPPLVFLMLPIMALVFKFLFLNRGFFYTEHLIYIVYSHCFLFLMQSFIALLEVLAIPSVTEGISTLIILWIVIYLIWSFKYVYQLSWPALLWRLPIVGLTYLTMISMMAVVLFILGVITL